MSSASRPDDGAPGRDPGDPPAGVLARVAADPSRRITAGVLLAMGGAVLFSAKAIFVKLSYRHGVDAVTLIALRMAFSVPFFIAVAWWSGRTAPALTGVDLRRLVLIGLLGYYGASYLDFLGLQFISASLERLILYLTPTLVVLLSAVFLRRPITRRDLLAIVLAYGGIVLAFSHDLSVEGADVPLGAALVLASAVSYASYLVISGQAVARLGALRLTAWAMCVASAACLVQFLVLRPWALIVQQPPPVYGWSLANAMFSTVLPVFATMMAVERIGASRAALASSVGPVATIGLAFVALGEVVTALQLVGAALVLAGVFVISRPARVVVED